MFTSDTVVVLERLDVVCLRLLEELLDTADDAETHVREHVLFDKREDHGDMLAQPDGIALHLDQPLVRERLGVSLLVEAQVVRGLRAKHDMCCNEKNKSPSEAVDLRGRTPADLREVVLLQLRVDLENDRVKLVEVGRGQKLCAYAEVVHSDHSVQRMKMLDHLLGLRSIAFVDALQSGEDRGDFSIEASSAFGDHETLQHRELVGASARRTSGKNAVHSGELHVADLREGELTVRTTSLLIVTCTGFRYLLLGQTLLGRRVVAVLWPKPELVRRCLVVYEDAAVEQGVVRSDRGVCHGGHHLPRVRDQQIRDHLNDPRLADATASRRQLMWRHLILRWVRRVESS